jgi:hypothetical protein
MIQVITEQCQIIYTIIQRILTKQYWNDFLEFITGFPKLILLTLLIMGIVFEMNGYTIDYAQTITQAFIAIWFVYEYLYKQMKGKPY